MAWSWEEMYAKATIYYNEHGNLLVPQSFTCEDGASLGKWINTQRAVRNGIRSGILDTKRIGLLDAIGMDWNPNLTAWNKAYGELKEFHFENGHINVPLRFVTKSGFKLGLWLQNQRRAYLKKGRGSLNYAQIEQLELLDIVWDPYRDQWMKKYCILKSYYDINGNIEIPREYTVDGIDIYRWLDTQRATYNGIGKGVLDETQIELLEKLGVNWGNKLDDRWNEMFGYAKAFFEEYGHLNMLQTYITSDGHRLGSWIFTQRQNWRDQKIDISRKELLDTIGMVWDYTSKKQTSFYEQAIYYYISKLFPDVRNRDKRFGVELDIYIPSKQVAIEYDGQLYHGVEKSNSDEQKNTLCKNLGIDLYRIREKDCAVMVDDSQNIYLMENTVSAFESALHELISILTGDSTIDVNINRDCGEIYSQYMMVGPAINEKDSANYIISTEWIEYYTLAENYYKSNGHLLICKNQLYNNKELGNWISNQRHYYNSKQTQLATQKVMLLEKIGMIWDVNEFKWQLGFHYAEQYYKDNGHLLVPSKCVVDDFQLGHWISNQRSKKTEKYKTSGTLTSVQIDKLESIGMVWNLLDAKWCHMYFLAKKYYEHYGHLVVPNTCIFEGEKLGQWIAAQRSNYKTGNNSNFNDEKIKKLEEIGMQWQIGRGNAYSPYYEEKWEAMFELLKLELEKNPLEMITKRYITESGIQLGQWVYRQKRIYAGKDAGTLNEVKIERLKSLNVI